MRLAVPVAAAAALFFGGALERDVAAARCSPTGAKQVARAGTARSDVDGDGALDRVWIGRTGPCWFVFAQTRGGTRSAPLRQDGLETSYWHPTNRLPRLGRRVDIDGHPGVDIFVVVDGGASTSAYGFFSLRGDRLVRLRKQHGAFTDAFFDGGSGNRLFSFGCARRGLLVQGAASTADGVRYSGRRDFYSLVGTVFRYTGQSRYRNASGAGLRAYAEMSARPFARCAD
jgi:hypothetical protein